MNAIKEWYLDGILILESGYDLCIFLISLGISWLLLLWRFFPEDLKTCSIFLIFVLAYTIISGILLNFDISFLSDFRFKLLIYGTSVTVFLHNCSSTLILKELGFLVVGIILFLVYYMLFYDAFILPESTEEIFDIIDIVRNVYGWIIHTLPFIMSIVFKASISIIIILALYLLCIPCICKISDYFGFFDSVDLF